MIIIQQYHKLPSIPMAYDTNEMANKGRKISSLNEKFPKIPDPKRYNVSVCFALRFHGSETGVVFERVDCALAPNHLRYMYCNVWLSVINTIKNPNSVKEG